MRHYKNIMLTGACGFIGSNFVRYFFDQCESDANLINVDKLTYAGNPENLEDISGKYLNDRYFFYQTDICDRAEIENIMQTHHVDCIIHFAAESHVDRSILGAADFMQTNIIGTFTLLEVAKKLWKDRTDVLFHHISTDEVYGSLSDEGYFYENTPYDPRNPYSASKASSDHLVSAYHHTHHLPVTISNCSNNYGPYQFPEKLIPLMIMNMKNQKPLPVYGDGRNIRDWLYVEDHCSGIWKIVTQGRIGETYNIGGENEWENIKLLQEMCAMMDELFPDQAPHERLITYVKDRPGHDRRYAINCDKIKNELNWTQSLSFAEGLKKTMNWYLNNEKWIENVRSGEYLKWIDKNYNKR